jgi:catechol 2,3-dioxygenase-like lactoylglutathione lyase family enzyme
MGMTMAEADTKVKASVGGPAKLGEFAHVSFPCRDLEEGKRFYRDVLGGELHVDTPTFCSFRLGGVDVGIGTEGCTFIGPSAEYPHIAFYVGPDELVAMKEWLAECGVPTSNFWTRAGVETLMFFRDPSGNVIELFCLKGYKGADKLPKGPPRGHGTAVDIDALRYDKWKPPEKQAGR